MDINLLPSVNADGKKLEVNVELDFSGYGEQSVLFLSPVAVNGAFVNVGGSIEFKATAGAKVSYECDRCCESFEDSISFEIDELLKKEISKEGGDENPDVIYFTGNTVI